MLRSHDQLATTLFITLSLLSDNLTCGINESWLVVMHGAIAIFMPHMSTTVLLARAT